MIELRKEEVKVVVCIMGVKMRLNLVMLDCGLYMKEEYICEIVKVICIYKLKLVFVLYYEDCYLDYVNCVKFVEEVIFLVGICKYMLEFLLYCVEFFYNYMINGFYKLNFCIDISEYFFIKVEVLEVYES